MTDAATHAQIGAAHPDQSTWLSANAGSGKTRVLTNRVARLLLHGVNPQNILCLTYTKAAASEMQNRLFQTLGAWAMLDDGALRDALGKLGEHTTGDLGTARTLFASAIEAPGGLKIQTIHSLCSSILRQFPLEAGVSPQFREIDERDQVTLIEEVLDGMAASGSGALQGAAMVYPDDTLVTLARDVSKNADAYQKKRKAPDIFAAFGLLPGHTIDDLLNETFRDGDIAFLKSLVPVLRQGGMPQDLKLAKALDGLPDAPSKNALTLLEKEFLTGKGANNPFRAKTGKIPTSDVRNSARFSALLSELETIMRRVERARAIRISLAAAEQTLAMHAFANAFLPAYEAAKRDAGVLDFDDLIRLTRKLLTRRSMQWVMYRLDGRIDHILVDEAQDTSPAQWDVIEALAEEMASGEGERPRTLFVVGDKKQSIYSFQGADAAGFDRRAGSFHDRLAGGQGLATASLDHSFRSSPAILTLVDHVFQDFAASHQAYHADMAGRVDLWPLVARPDPSDEPAWYETGDRTVANAASHRLAEAMARQIDELIENGTIQGENGPRRIRPGDVMVLVQRRSDLFDEIIQACKKRNLDIAGADRLKVGSELAVRDLLALLSFLALADDSLSLAAALRSPLFGWSEQDLYTLASGRRDKSTLWAELRRRKDDFPETHSELTELRRLVDFKRPYELLDTILTRFGGRVKLLERLGPEAEDGINELLNQALAYEREAVPSLTGFLDVAEASDIEVKRQSDTSGDMIRVMTVHGAKGLESPIVILPDTTFGNPAHNNDLVDADGLAVLPIRDEECPPNVRAAKSAKKAADQEERDRLLYVAMTRAEKWLIVAGVEPPPNAPKSIRNWHQRIEAGLERAGAQCLETDHGKGLRLAFGTWPELPKSTDSVTELKGEPAALPDLGSAPAQRPQRTVLSPSDLGGAKVLGGGALDEEMAKRRGRQVHLLLEHLPDAADPAKMAERLLSHGSDAARPEDMPNLLKEAEGTIARNPAVFSPDALAEVGIVAELPVLNATISGTIDRLLLSEDRVLAVDFKTNAVVPDAPDKTPEGLLRQMGAYLEALEQVYPDKKIEVAILWTATGKLMALEHGIVRAALRRAPTS